MRLNYASATRSLIASSQVVERAAAALLMSPDERSRVQQREEVEGLLANAHTSSAGTCARRKHKAGIAVYELHHIEQIVCGAEI